MSNLRQIGLGAMQYIQDYDGRYAPNTMRDESNGDSSHQYSIKNTNKSYPSGASKVQHHAEAADHYQTWMDAIFPYAKSTQVFVCPSRRRSTDPSYGYNTALGGYWNFYRYYCGSTGCGSNYTPISESAATRPSEIIMFMDYNFQIADIAQPSDMNQAVKNGMSLLHITWTVAMPPTQTVISNGARAPS